MSKYVNTIEQLRRRKYKVRREIADCENYFEESYENFMQPIDTISDAFKGDKNARHEIFSTVLTPRTLIGVVTGIIGSIHFVKGKLTGRRKRKKKHSRSLKSRHR